MILGIMDERKAVETMGKLRELPNISTIIEAKLLRAGIDTPEKLIKLGSREAFRRIKRQDETACVNMLCALEGAVRGVRWFSMTEQDKKALREFYKTL